MARTARRVVKRGDGDAGGTIDPASSGISDGDVDGSGDIGTGGTLIIDPADIGGLDGSDGGNSGSDTGGTSPRRRGRKPGSTASNKKVLLDVSGVEQLLFSVHMMLAGLTRTPEIMLEEKEAHLLAEAMGKVSRHYDVTVGAKAMDWANLMMCAGMVYGPRLVAARQRSRGGARVSAPPAQPASPSPAPAAPPASDNSKVTIPGLGTFDVGTAQ